MITFNLSFNSVLTVRNKSQIMWRDAATIYGQIMLDRGRVTTRSVTVADPKSLLCIVLVWFKTLIEYWSSPFAIFCAFRFSNTIAKDCKRFVLSRFKKAGRFQKSSILIAVTLFWRVALVSLVRHNTTSFLLF